MCLLKDFIAAVSHEQYVGNALPQGPDFIESKGISGIFTVRKNLCFAQKLSWQSHLYMTGWRIFL